MMNVIENYLTINQYSRPGRRLVVCKGIILHDVRIPNQRAAITWNYFEIDCSRNKHYSSAHYIVDINGDILHAVPDNEVAYHCGTDKIDPASGRIYTDWARRKFGDYASDPAKNSPNNCTIGIELCVDRQGNFTNETTIAAIALVAKLLEKNNLSVEDIGHHNKVVGWKDCPLPWIKNPELFEVFKDRVRQIGIHANLSDRSFVRNSQNSNIDGVSRGTKLQLKL
jgi:N-acetylmuramoyl-L-alanine amidase